MSFEQITFDFTPPPAVGAVHIGPIQEDDGDGCDCCAQRLLCGKCGARYLGRLYAYYYDHRTVDADGYMVGYNGAYGNLPGPCCLEDDPVKYEAYLLDDDAGYAALLSSDELIRKGQFVFGAWGVLRGRIWIPAAWPVGESPWKKRIREDNAPRRRKAKVSRCQTTCEG